MRAFRPEDIFLLELAADPQPSPDGRSVAFTLTQADEEADGYRSSIHLVPTAGGEPISLTRGEKDSMPRWSPDGRWLAFVRAAEGGRPQAWVLPTNGGEARPVTDLPGGVGAIRWSPDSRRLAMTSVTGEIDGEPPLEVRRLDAKVDSQGWVGARRSHLFVADTNAPIGDPVQVTSGDYHVSTVSWSPDGRRLAFASAQHDTRDLDGVSNVFVVDAGGGETRQVTCDWQGSAAMPSWTPTSDEIVFGGSSRALATGHTELFRVPATGGQATAFLDGFDRNVMLGAPAYPGSQPVVTPDGQVVFCARDGGCVHVFTAPLRGGRATKILGGDRVFSDVRLAGGATLVYMSAGPASTNDVHAGESRLTRTSARFFDEVVLHLPVRRMFTSPDGTAIEGWVINGDGDHGRPRPLLLDIHGGPHNAWGPAFDHAHGYHQMLAQSGWAVLMINSRGSDGYGVDFYRALHRGWGRNDLDDFMAAVDTLVAEGVADPDRLALAGYSYGGYMVNWIVTQTDRFAAAVTGGTVSDLASFYGTSDVGGALGVSELGAELADEPDLYRELSPVTHAAAVTTPTLILHGADDLRCPVGQAEQWFTALRRAGKTAEMVLYPGASHLMILNGRPAHRIDYSQRVVDWLTRHT